MGWNVAGHPEGIRPPVEEFELVKGLDLKPGMTVIFGTESAPEYVEVYDVIGPGVNGGVWVEWSDGDAGYVPSSGTYKVAKES